MAISSKGTRSSELVGEVVSAASVKIGPGVRVFPGSGVQVSGRITGALVGELVGLSVVLRVMQALDKNTTAKKIQNVQCILRGIGSV
jgi:hypothetical protein